MDKRDYTAANLLGWEEVAPLHKKQNFERLMTDFRTPGYSVLDPIETACLQKIGVAGKSVTQICCNNGQELLSVKNMGAGRCVGFDGAQGFIDQAQALAEAAGRECEFVQTDIYDIPSGYGSAFDLATITIGVLGWMPDLPEFFNICAGLLKPGGDLFIYEQHSILNMFEPGAGDAPMAFDHSYFRTTPFIETDGLDYYEGGRYQSKPLYSFPYKMSDIFTAAIDAGMTVTHFEELPGHISNCWYNVEAAKVGLPMSFTLILNKAKC